MDCLFLHSIWLHLIYLLFELGNLGHGGWCCAGWVFFDLHLPEPVFKSIEAREIRGVLRARGFDDITIDFHARAKHVDRDLLGLLHDHDDLYVAIRATRARDGRTGRHPVEVYNSWMRTARVEAEAEMFEDEHIVEDGNIPVHPRLKGIIDRSLYAHGDEL